MPNTSHAAREALWEGTEVDSALSEGALSPAQYRRCWDAAVKLFQCVQSTRADRGRFSGEDRSVRSLDAGRTAYSFWRNLAGGLLA
jgi:hypothetical protein